jgi:hypothetical protein
MELPNNGCFENIQNYNIESLINYFVNTKKFEKVTCNSSQYIIAWNHVSYWYCSVGSAKTVFTQEDLKEYVKNKIVLENKWHVIVTKENQKVLSDWRFENHNHILDIGYIVGMTNSNSCSTSNLYEKGHNPVSSKENFGKEITYQEFEKYILVNEKYEKRIVLPLKWCIKYCDEVSEYAYKKWKCIKRITESYYHEGGTYKTIANNNFLYIFKEKILEGHTEISLKDFKKYLSQTTVEVNLPQTQIIENGKSSKQKRAEERSCITLRRINSAISRGDQIRKTSIRSSKSKITIGSVNCNY